MSKATGTDAILRTSAADPIRVDLLAAAAVWLPGRIGLTIAPGKKDRFARWDRDLDTDLERLRDTYDTRLLVSLLEDHELELLGITALAARTRAQGMEFVAFPIRDASVPRPDDLPAATALVAATLTAVRDGATVVIHCRGGLGRSGTIAAACLVAIGHPPHAAIEIVRACRPGAIETREQESWVHDFAAACVFAGGDAG